MLIEAPALRLDRVDEFELLGCSDGKPGVQGAAVGKAAAVHLRDLLVMTTVERRQPTTPSHGLRMARVAAFARRQYRPDCMKLPVLAQQVLVAKSGRVDVPDPHASSLQGRRRSVSSV